MNKEKLEYIASGTAYLQLASIRNATSEAQRDIFEQLFAHVHAETNHKFGVLFNAFTEQSFGPRIANYKGLSSVHSDSGGLQIITKGEKVTAKIKSEIYKVQGNYSDYGMSFDEIPVGMTGSKSGRNQTGNRWFKADELEHFASETGKNIHNQINTFLDQKSKCKPILIAQGNCYDSYMKWVEVIMKEIPQDKHKYIGGVAMGAAALGTGSLEDIERAFYFNQLPIENNNYLHVLGIGSMKRMIPYIIFMQNGLYDGVRVSYDSTTHTSGVAFGHYYSKKDGLLSFNRNLTMEYYTFYDDIANILDISDLNVQNLHQLMNGSAKKHDNDNQFFRCVAGFIMSSITNFIKDLDKVVESKTKLLSIADKADFYSPAKYLYEVKNKTDFDHWYTSFRNYIPSKRVPSSKKSTLEGFFE